MRFVATKATIFFDIFTKIVLAGIHSKTETKEYHVNRGKEMKLTKEEPGV